MSNLEIKVKYLSKEIPKLKMIAQGDWVDLYIDNIKDISKNGKSRYKGMSPKQVAKSIEEQTSFHKSYGAMEFWRGEVVTFGLGVAMELPEGYEAIIASRSSIFNNFNARQTNGIGVVDNSYCGDEDEWLIQVEILQDITICRHTRICQFRIQESQPKIDFIEVERLGNQNRGGYGSTGTQEIKNQGECMEIELNSNMGYYEIEEPYYALIKADDIIKAITCYNNEVAELDYLNEDESVKIIKLDSETAKEKLSKIYKIGVNFDTIESLKTGLENIKSPETTVLVMDGSLN